MEDEFNFLGELGLVLMAICLAVIIIPLLLGIGIALIIGVSGFVYYGVVITIAAFLWLLFGLMVLI